MTAPQASRLERLDALAGLLRAALAEIEELKADAAAVDVAQLTNPNLDSPDGEYLPAGRVHNTLAKALGWNFSPKTFCRMAAGRIVGPRGGRVVKRSDADDILREQLAARAPPATMEAG
jgi:hypothetical protein